VEKEAKGLVGQDRSGDAAAIERFRAASPRDEEPPTDAALADAQFVIAREHGFETWAKLKHHIHALRPPGLELYERLAKAVADAYMSGDKEEIRQINWDYGTSFSWEREPAALHARLPNWFASESRSPNLALADAQDIIARAYGFETWKQFAASASQPAGNPRSAPLFISSGPPFYKIDWKDNRL